jgi:hypothetical protein
MMSEQIAECEVKVKGAWLSVTIDKALGLHPERVLRCPECHGRVRAHNASEDGGMRAHFEHRVGHEGCSRGHYFKGHSSPHPRRLL